VAGVRGTFSPVKCPHNVEGVKPRKRHGVGGVARGEGEAPIGDEVSVRIGAIDLKFRATGTRKPS
jgi:hypothetical protein